MKISVSIAGNIFTIDKVDSVTIEGDSTIRPRHLEERQINRWLEYVEINGRVLAVSLDESILCVPLELRQQVRDAYYKKYGINPKNGVR